MDELEESLILEELYVLAHATQVREHRLIRKLGAIQGVDIPDLEDAAQEEPDKKPELDFRSKIESKLSKEKPDKMGEAVTGIPGTGYQQV